MHAHANRRAHNMSGPTAIRQIRPTEAQLRALRRITGADDDAEAVMHAIERVIREDREDRDFGRKFRAGLRDSWKKSKPIDDWDAMMEDVRQRAEAIKRSRAKRA
jgi:hypothetical protein